jgi:hypothetical protein
VGRCEEDLQRRDCGAQDVHAHLCLRVHFYDGKVEEDRFAAERFVEGDESQGGDWDQAGLMMVSGRLANGRFQSLTLNELRRRT